MPLLREDLLTPIPGPKPSGENLRYDPVYDKIKEARQEDEDDAPKGDWDRTPKKADFALVIKLAGEALAKRSKDLQLVAWLGEAMLRRHSFAALPECIALFRQVQEQFWETCYPEIEDGSPEFRRTSQEWFAARCDHILVRLPLAKDGLNWIQYQQSRAVPSEEDAELDEKKREAREDAIKQEKLTPEEWTESFKSTPIALYEEALAGLNAGLEAVSELDKFCDVKYGTEGPNFAKLRSALEQVKLTANTFFLEKGGSVQADGEQPSELPGLVAGAVSGSGAAVAPARARATGSWAEPASPEAAIDIIARASEYLRKQDASQVSPYLITRALRWGELRFQGDSPDESFLAKPSSDTREQLRQLHRDSNWEELLNRVEAAVASPCGRGWLDLQRYAWEACYNLSYSTAEKAIRSETGALLRDYPDLASMCLSDGTPVADQQTRDWIAQYVLPPAQESVTETPQYAEREASGQENGHADYFEVAMQLAKAGRVGEAINGFSREAAREICGRERFRRQVQLAQICLLTQHYALALPILQGLTEEIERRNLLDWEDPDLLSQVLAMLVQCIDRTSRDPQERGRAYGLLCRLGPAAALQFEKA